MPEELIDPPENPIVDPAEAEDDDVERDIRYTLSSYGADYPVDGLVKRLERGDIFIPKFQRGYVWTQVQASQFVESLLVGLPVPGVFLYKEPDTQKLMVVDGQQRLVSLQHFYSGVIRGKEFALKNVTKGLRGATYKSLREEDRRRLDDAVVHATIFGQEDPKEEDRSSVYFIFERLNTSGTPLVPQEIRACVYRGPFNDLLASLSEFDAWKQLFGGPSLRSKDQELILRFFALYYGLERYKRPMSEFLNSFMEWNRRLDKIPQAELRQRFQTVVSLAVEALKPAAFRPERNLNAALTEALLVGLAHRLERGPVRGFDGLRKAYVLLMEDKRFETAYKRSTTDPDFVRDRVRAATEAFGQAI